MFAKKFQDFQLQGFGSAKAFLFDTIESTHSLMKEKARSGEISAGTLFVADTQSKGRGRHERTWESPAGKNLYFNILIPLDGIPANRYAQITQIAALTFAEIFISMQEDGELNKRSQGPAITVKWPNDILYGKSKFCGILSEIVFTPNGPALSMGVGLNVNSEPIEYASLGCDVTTLKAILGREVDREKLLQALIAGLERATLQFKAFGILPWVDAWRKMDKFLGARGTIIEKDSSGKAIQIQGKILDMQNDGSLLFECDNGEIKTVYSADLEI